jgi:LacI family transcriptional regulator
VPGVRRGGRDVASRAGVSIGTVSNVVNRPQVVAAIRSRVESVIGARLRLRRVRVSTTGRTNPHTRSLVLDLGNRSLNLDDSSCFADR